VQQQRALQECQRCCCRFKLKELWEPRPCSLQLLWLLATSDFSSVCVLPRPGLLLLLLLLLFPQQLLLLPLALLFKGLNRLCSRSHSSSCASASCRVPLPTGGPRCHAMAAVERSEHVGWFLGQDNRCNICCWLCVTGEDWLEAADYSINLTELVCTHP
jgi:hypothetical protein